jgi:hypothetical protein
MTTAHTERRSNYRMRADVSTVWWRALRRQINGYAAIIALQDLGLTRDGALRVLCKPAYPKTQRTLPCYSPHSSQQS